MNLSPNSPSLREISTLACAALFLIIGPRLHAQELPAVTARYEQILLRTPEKGTPFDKVYQHYFENEGLESLSQRWQAGTNGTEGGRYELLLGLLLERQGKPAEARKAYARATAAIPGDFRAWKALGELEASEGKLAAAITALEKALPAATDADARAAIYRKLAQVQQRNFETPAALATWKKMAGEFPDNPFVAAEVADALADAEQFADAKAAYTRMRDLSGADPFQKITATVRLAQLEERQGKPAEALAIYEGLLPDAKEGSWVYRDVRARIEEIYRRQDDLPGLAGYYEKWLATHDKDVEAASRLSRTLLELNRKRDAAKWLEMASQWAPDRREFQVELAKLFPQIGQEEAAAKLLTRLTESFPDELSYQELLGGTQWLLFQKSRDEKQKAAALAAWRKLAPADAKDASTVIRLAEILRANQLNAEALAEYERAAALAPEQADLQERHAAFLFELKRDEEAWKVLDALVEGSCATAANYQRLASVQSRRGKAEAALESTGRGLALDPGNFTLLSLRWRLLSQAEKWEEAAALYGPMLAANPSAYDQIEAQCLQALQSAGKLAATGEALSAKLSEADENEVRLLARIALQSENLPLLNKALDEGKSRFPKSLPLALIEAESARQAGELKPRIEALRRSMEIDPKQAGNILRDIARAYQEETMLREALEAASEWIKASPANTDARIFYADLCFAADKPEAGIATLRAAIKESEKPNPVRQRLARAYTDQNQHEAARAVYEEAFESEQDPPARLAALRRLSENYLQQGKIDVLISRFRERQSGEEGGWRYAIYLAEIYQQIQNFGQAREELSKALAARPRDPALLKQLIRLAESESNAVEVIRYQRLLADADPSPENRAALATTLTENDGVDEAIAILTTSQADLLKDLAPWRNVLINVQRSKASNPLLSTLEASLQERPEAFQEWLTLAEIQIAAENTESAARLINAVRKMPQPMIAASSGEAETPAAPRRNVSRSDSVTQANTRRLNRSNTIQRNFWELTDFMRYRSGNDRRTPPKTAIANLQEAQDTALVYLACLAVSQDKADDFVATMEKETAASTASRLERLTEYALVQARAPLWKEIEAQAQAPEADLDSLALSQLTFLQNSAEPGSAETTRAAELTTLFKKRIADEKKASRDTRFEEYNELKAAEKTEEANQVLHSLLEKVDENEEADLRTAFRAALLLRDLPQAERFLTVMTEHSKISPNLLARNRASLAKAYRDAKDYPAASRNYAESLKINILSDATGDAGSVSGFTSRRGRSSRSSTTNATQASPPLTNRYFGENRLRLLQQFHREMKGTPALNAFQTAVASMEVPEPKKIQPLLALAYLQWWDGKKQAAAKELQTLAESTQDEQLHLGAAAMLADLKKYPEAIKLLKDVPMAPGQNYKMAQQLIFDYAGKTKDDKSRRQALLHLLDLKPTPDEILTLLPEMKKLGLQAQAEQLSQQMAKGGHRDQQRTVNLLREYQNANNEAAGIALARTLLARSSSQARWNNDYVASVAMETLRRFNVLEAFTEELQRQLDAAPDSIRLCIQLGDLWMRQDSSKALGFYRKALELRPNDLSLKINLMELLMQQNQSAEAIKMLEALSKENPEILFNGRVDLIWGFKQAKKLPTLANLILAIPKPNASSAGRHQQSPEYLCMRLGSELRQEGETDLALQVWRKGLELTPPGRSSSNLRFPLIELLVQQGKNEEAIEQIDCFFFPPLKVEPLLGSATQRGRADWFSITIHQSSGASSPTLALLSTAAKLGVIDSLQKRVEALTPDPETKRLGYMIRLVKRDPKLLEEFPAYLASGKEEPPSMDESFAHLLASELARWPEAKSLAFEAFETAKVLADRNTRNIYSRLALRLQIARIAAEQKVTETEREAYKEWTELFVSNFNPNQGFDSNQLLNVCQNLARLGMFDEADKLLATARTAVEARQSNTWLGQQLPKIEAEIAMAKGEFKNPQAIAFYGEENGKTTIYWEMTSTSRPILSFYGYSTIGTNLGGREYPNLDGRFDVEILHYTSPNTIQRIALIPKAKNRGQWSGKIPEGHGAIQAVLHAGNGRSYYGVWTQYSSTPNLIVNPSFKGVGDGKEQPKEIEGWPQLPTGDWSLQPGGLYPGNPSVFFRKTNTGQAEIVGEPIPLKNGGADYLLSVWIKFEENYAQISLRYLDKDKKVVGAEQMYGNSQPGKWSLFQNIYSSNGNRQGNIRRISSQAAFVQPVFQIHSSSVSIDGLYFGEITLSEGNEQ